MTGDRMKRGTARKGASVLAAALTLSACSMDVDNPGGITDPDLETPIAIDALVNGVAGDYYSATRRSALFSGVLSDELRASGSWPSWKAADLQGTIDLNVTSSGMANIPDEWWRSLQRARVLAEDTYGRLDRVLPGAEGDAPRALTRTFSGMAYRDIAEYFCVATYDGGPAVEREASLQIARTHLTEAIALAEAAGAGPTAALAHLARAKVNLSLGDLAAAGADARAVPQDFLWAAPHHANATNELFVYLNEQWVATVQQEFWRTGDPRAPVQDAGKTALDGVTPRWDQMKYASRTASIPVGKWQEARLIEAEVELRQGQPVAALTLLNEVRAAAGLEPLSLLLPEARAWEALKLERKYELFLEGERMLDMRRFDEFAAGWATCSPLPRSETDNNPNL